VSTVYLSVSFFLALLCARRATIISPATVWCIYLFLCLVVYEWVITTNLTRADSVFSGMPLQYVAEPYHQTYIYFIFFQIIAIASVLGIRRPRRWFNFDAAPLIKLARASRGNLALLILLVLVLLSVLHFIAIDKSVLWLNYEYKSIKNPASIGATDPLSRIYHFLFRFVGLVAIALCVVYWHSKAIPHFLVAFALASYALLFLLADNSRWVPVYFICVLIVNFSLSKRPLGALFWVNLSLVFITFAKVLTGRSLPTQGVASIIPGFYELEFSQIAFYAEGFFTNIFPGALNFANTLALDGETTRSIS